MKLTGRGWVVLVVVIAALIVLGALFLHGPYDDVAKHGVIMGSEWS